MNYDKPIRMDSYEFTQPNERLLARVVDSNNHYNLKMNDLIILGTTPKVYYHPKNVYAYDLDTHKPLGRYSLSYFEIIGVFDSIDELAAATSKYEKEKVVEEVHEDVNEFGYTQLSLFD